MIPLVASEWGEGTLGSVGEAIVSHLDYSTSRDAEGVERHTVSMLWSAGG